MINYASDICGTARQPSELIHKGTEQVSFTCYRQRWLREYYGTKTGPSAVFSQWPWPSVSSLSFSFAAGPLTSLSSPMTDPPLLSSSSIASLDSLSLSVTRSPLSSSSSVVPVVLLSLSQFDRFTPFLFVHCPVGLIVFVRDPLTSFLFVCCLVVLVVALP